MKARRGNHLLIGAPYLEKQDVIFPIIMLVSLNVKKPAVVLLFPQFG
jgi:hypothetical protein